MDLDQPVYELIESPLLYLATDQSFKLTAAQVRRLREYVDAGGMVVCVPEGNRRHLPMAAMKALAEELCPGVRPITRTDLKHPFYWLSGKMTRPIPTIAYESSTRPRVVIVYKDIGRDLQANAAKDRDAFDLMTNIYLYAVGKDARRARVASNYVVQRNARPKAKVAAARLNCGGDFDPEPLAMPQVKAMVADRLDVDLDVREMTPEQLDASVKVAFLTVTTGTKVSDAQAQAVQAWSDGGGLLWVDAGGGGADAVEAMDNLLPRLGLTRHALARWNGSTGPLPATMSTTVPATMATTRTTTSPTTMMTATTGPTTRAVAMPRGYDPSPLALRPYRNEDGGQASLSVKRVGGRAVAYVCRGDLTAGLAGVNHWGIAGYTPKSARQLVTNSLAHFAPVPPPPPPATRPATQATTRPATRVTRPGA